jgi:riboflavin kinase/FMN adenylyltransferase
MQFFVSPSEVPTGFGPSALTVGKFDGVHLGHRRVLDVLVTLAAERGLVPTVVTFDRNPLELLAPDRCPAPLVSNAQKAELLESAGVQATLMLEFDRALAAMSPEEFVRELLVGALNARVVLAGADFRFGAKGAGDVELLGRLGEELGFVVVPIDDVRADDAVSSRRASSTWVRELLDEGDVRQAAVLLGRLPSIRSKVVRGEQRGRILGYPTANLDRDLEGFLPLDGVYACWAIVGGVRYGAAVSIGNNPTFDGVPHHQVEAHLFDQQLDLYGRTVTLEFVDRIRAMNRFDSVDALVAQLQTDDHDIRAVLAAEPA